MTHTLIKAYRLAHLMHRGQTDKVGKPFIAHPRALVEILSKAGADENTLSVAWLHDVVEDTDVTIGDLVDRCFPLEVIHAVEAITHRVNEPNVDYYRRVHGNWMATVVKMADLRHNSSAERLEGLDEATRQRLEAKYAFAKAYFAALGWSWERVVADLGASDDGDGADGLQQAS